MSGDDGLLDTRYGFALPARITPQEQLDVLRHVRAAGQLKGGMDDGAAPYWNTLFATEVDATSVAPQVAAWLAEHPQRHTSWTYLSRLDPAVRWRWVESPASQVIRRVLDRLPALFQRLTRVKVFVQIPGHAIASHRDLVVGNRYRRMANAESAELGDREMVYIGRSWITEVRPDPLNDLHRRQGYFSLKIPLSERPDNAGRPYLVVDGERRYVSSDGALYFLNEAECLHGVEAAQHYRGVVFVDGFFDLDVFAALPRIPLRLTGRRPASAAEQI
jgi:hypothetical protein